MKFELFFELVYWCIDSVCLVNVNNYVVNIRPHLLTFKGLGTPILMRGSQEIYPAPTFASACYWNSIFNEDSNG